jgi:predicted PurR-regulated permease PerM
LRARKSIFSPSSNVAEPAKPIPVEIRQPDLEPLELVRSVVGPLLQPLAVSGPVIVFIIMILIDWEDLRDRLLRLRGRHDLYRTTEAMNQAAQRVRRYLTRRLIVNMSCGLPIGIGLTMIGIPHAALWAIFVLSLRFIPYLGIVIAACFPLALATAVDTVAVDDLALRSGRAHCRELRRTSGLRIYRWWR